MAQDQRLQQILDRIQAIELNIAPASEDLNDPPFYATDADGHPVSTQAIDKIADYIRDLPIFTGDPNEVTNWINDVEGIIQFYKPKPNSSIDDRNKFHVICKIIRRKIKGEANDALVSSNVNINWTAIKRVLLTYYGEKRDINTLDYQLMTCYQKGKSLEDYFEEINKILSLIANQIRSSGKYQHPEAIKALIETYNEKALDAFMRGLDGELLGQFVKNYRPESLAQAYAYCISFQNIEFRKNISKSQKLDKVNTGAIPKNQIPSIPRIPPRIPPRIHNFRNYQQFQPFQPFQQQQQQPPRYQQPFIPRMNTPPFFQPPRQPLPNFRPAPPIPQRRERQEPMEVDQSLQTKQINYSNRPQNVYQAPPQKRPRLYFTPTSPWSPESQPYYVEDPYQYYDNGYYEVEQENQQEQQMQMDRYMKMYEAQVNNKDQLTNDDEENENVEFNFLE